jgi:hypothetical protein
MNNDVPNASAVPDTSAVTYSVPDQVPDQGPDQGPDSLGPDSLGPDALGPDADAEPEVFFRQYMIYYDI